MGISSTFAPRRPRTSTGLVRSLVVSSPSWPVQLLPQAISVVTIPGLWVEATVVAPWIVVRSWVVVACWVAVSLACWQAVIAWLLRATTAIVIASTI